MPRKVQISPTGYEETGSRRNGWEGWPGSGVLGSRSEVPHRHWEVIERSSVELHWTIAMQTTSREGKLR